MYNHHWLDGSSAPDLRQHVTHSSCLGVQIVLAMLVGLHLDGNAANHVHTKATSLFNFVWVVGDQLDTIQLKVL